MSVMRGIIMTEDHEQGCNGHKGTTIFLPKISLDVAKRQLLANLTIHYFSKLLKNVWTHGMVSWASLHTFLH